MKNSTSSNRSEIESHCIATLLLSTQDALAAAAAGLRTDHFESVVCGEIYAAIIAAAMQHGDRIPFEVLYGSAKVGGEQFAASDLVEIARLESTSIHRDQYIAAVITAARRDRLAMHLKRAADQVGKVGSPQWADIWASVSPELSAINDLAQDRRAQAFADFCAEYADTQRHPDKIKTVSLGIEHWDREATPVKSHELIALAGRPGTGKTALALQMANHIAVKKGGNVAFFSLEMSGVELVDRLAKHRAGADGVGDHPTEVEQRLREVEFLSSLKTLFVFDDGRVTIDDIEARARLLASAPGGLALVVIDYLQLITPSSEARRQPREQQVAEISRRLKLLPKAIGAPVIILAQLNRESERENRPPRKSDLRESGAIEQDSDRVWFLYQPILKNDQVPANEAASVIDVCFLQDKCRGGPPGVMLTMEFERPCYRFTPKFFR